ncbi:hypothetical protein [Streptomyces sp. HUAS TT7]|uniref:hypothetical protein n=1 Tax=Streptomyces sp. HUAS TT7 TaxID=3447507 RepID=UPI003F65A34F
MAVKAEWKGCLVRQHHSLGRIGASLALMAFVAACGSGAKKSADVSTKASGSEVTIEGKTPCVALEGAQTTLKVHGKFEAVEPPLASPGDVAQSSCSLAPQEWEPGRTLMVTFADQGAENWLKSQGVTQAVRQQKAGRTLFKGQLPNQNLSCYSSIDAPSGKSINVQLSSIGGQGAASGNLCDEAVNVAGALAASTGLSTTTTSS